MTKTEIAEYWISAGGDPKKADVASAIALAESGGNNGINADSYGTQSAGLWQINSANWPNLIRQHVISSAQDLTDPLTNARAAIFISGNGQKFHPWTTYWSRDGGKHNLGDGNGIFRDYLSNNYVAPTPGTSNSSGNFLDNTLHAGEQILGGIEQSVGGAVSSIVSPWLNVPQSLLNLTSNLDAFFVGLILAAFGIGLIALSWGEDLANSVNKISQNMSQQAAQASAKKTAAPAAGAESEVADAAVLA